MSFCSAGQGGVVVGLYRTETPWNKNGQINSACKRSLDVASLLQVLQWCRPEGNRLSSDKQQHHSSQQRQQHQWDNPRYNSKLRNNRRNSRSWSQERRSMPQPWRFNNNNSSSKQQQRNNQWCRRSSFRVDSDCHSYKPQVKSAVIMSQVSLPIHFKQAWNSSKKKCEKD